MDKNLKQYNKKVNMQYRREKRQIWLLALCILPVLVLFSSRASHMGAMVEFAAIVCAVTAVLLYMYCQLRNHKKTNELYKRDLSNLLVEELSSDYQCHAGSSSIVSNEMIDSMKDYDVNATVMSVTVAGENSDCNWEGCMEVSRIKNKPDGSDYRSSSYSYHQTLTMVIKPYHFEAIGCNIRIKTGMFSGMINKVNAFFNSVGSIIETDPFLKQLQYVELPQAAEYQNCRVTSDQSEKCIRFLSSERMRNILELNHLAGNFSACYNDEQVVVVFHEFPIVDEQDSGTYESGIPARMNDEDLWRIHNLVGMIESHLILLWM